MFVSVCSLGLVEISSTSNEPRSTQKKSVQLSDCSSCSPVSTPADQLMSSLEFVSNEVLIEFLVQIKPPRSFFEVQEKFVRF